MGYGTLLQVEQSPGGGSYVTIAEITNLDYGGVTTNMLDATNMDSPGGLTEEVPGLKKNNMWTFDFNYLPGNATQNNAGTYGLMKLVLAGTLKNARIVWPNASASSITQAGYFVSVSAKAGVNTILGGSGSFQPIGQQTFANM